MTWKVEGTLEYYWRRVQLDLRDKEYFDATVNAYYLMLHCVVAAIIAIVGLPFLLPALLIMLVAKFRNRFL